MSERVEFDPESMTLGEVLAAERASGEDFQTLLRTTAGRLALGVFVQRLRSSGRPPSWSELTSLRLLDVSSSLSGFGPDSPSPKSSD